MIELVTTDGIFALDGGEWEVTNNIWLVGDDREVVVVDAAHDHRPIAEAVAGRRVAAIALTHGHNDHINAAVALQDAVDAPILLHPSDRMLWSVVYPDRDPDDPRTLSTSVNRGTLREILGAGLDDRIHYGRELAGHEPDAHGVTLRFVDGSSERADVLVGADGVHSAVRRTLLPGATTVDTGSRIIYGRTPLDATTRPLVPPAMHDGFTAVIGGHVGMAAGLVEFRQPPPQAAAAIAPAVRLSAVGDYVMWAVSAQRDRFPEPDAALAGMDATALHAAAGGAIRSWHPDLRALLDDAAVEETFLVRVRSSERVAAWTPSRVTVLGDAIHAMSPARGSGANTALQDAAILCAALTSGSDDVVAAIGGYEERMRDYGFAAVEASRQAESQNARRGNPLWLRILNRLPGSR